MTYDYQNAHEICILFLEDKYPDFHVSEVNLFSHLYLGALYYYLTSMILLKLHKTLTWFKKFNHHIHHRKE